MRFGDLWDAFMVVHPDTAMASTFYRGVLEAGRVYLVPGVDGVGIRGCAVWAQAQGLISAEEQQELFADAARMDRGREA
jgi:hypothetical protein